MRPLLHPHLRFRDGGIEIRGRGQVLGHLAERPTPKPPAEVELRDGQLYRWVREVGER